MNLLLVSEVGALSKSKMKHFSVSISPRVSALNNVWISFSIFPRPPSCVMW